MVALLPSDLRRLLAGLLCREVRRSVAASTRRASVGDTPVSPFTTRETVLMLTLARAATSLIVARDLSAFSDVIVSLLGMKHFRLHARLEFSRCSLNKSVLYRQRCLLTTLSLPDQWLSSK